VSPPEPIDPPPSAAEAALVGLNDAQRLAVTHGDGPLLVLAGAGSGKTRAITHRIAHLILARRVAPSRIIAVTFTNKAAGEMRERVETLLGARGIGGWIGTFHALCLRILRRDGERVGLEPGFNIYDSDDQLAVVKRILREQSMDTDAGTPRSFLGRISRAKNALEGPDDVERRSFLPNARLLAEVFRQYREVLRRANAVDFDDLLLRTLELFDEHAEVAESYSSRCEHLLVDEYQDTNRPQYLLIRHLSRVHGNVCVVGDEDQSIYRFRGAEIRNILEFEADHPGTHVIRLEQNYRSTGAILGAAGALIAHNQHRKGKTLWTENPQGDKVELSHTPDDRAEAIGVADRVRRLEPEISYEEMAVLYRTNAQSRLFEEIFRRDGIPYQIVGSLQFYERKEIKDLLAYLKLAANPADDVAFRRIVNTPSRGIGETTLRVVERTAREMGLPLMEAAGHALIDNRLATRSARRLQEFLDLAAETARRADDQPVASLLEHVVRTVKFAEYLEKSYPGMGDDRMENVRALISAAAEHAEEDEEAGLQSFLDRSALVSHSDEVGQRPGVTLMTIHCAKGLEFPVVFLAGLEERLFPHAMSNGSMEDIEEERRLCYVAMTRAQRRLFLSRAEVRRFQGAPLPSRPSRFLDEIPAELIDEIAPTSEGFFDDWRVRGASGEYRAGGSSAARAAARRKPTPTTVRKQPTATADPGDGFAVGATVLHPSFGGGRILDREGSGKHLKLTIHFSDHGQKKILPAYTKLRIEIG
jgi:DNA helicase-2/ATP-dependent DNA helicase PcrA